MRKSKDNNKNNNYNYSHCLTNIHFVIKQCSFIAKWYNNWVKSQTKLYKHLKMFCFTT